MLLNPSRCFCWLRQFCLVARGIRAPIGASEIFHLSLKRELDAEGRENACIAGGTLPLTSDARGLVHFSVVGCDYTCIKKSSLSIVCKAALESVDSLVVSGPTKCDGGGWVLTRLPICAIDRSCSIYRELTKLRSPMTSEGRGPWCCGETGRFGSNLYGSGEAHINKVIEASLDR